MGAFRYQKFWMFGKTIGVRCISGFLFPQMMVQAWLQIPTLRKARHHRIASPSSPR